jgi:putative FmdB family regulatory protein
MPCYEFRCKKCEHRLEVIQKFKDPYPTTCPACNEVDSLEKQISVGTTAQFKGPGFFVNDYKKRGK